MSQSDAGHVKSPAKDHGKAVNDAKVVEEKKHPAVGKPGEFKNDPADPTNPNEAIERARRQVRP